jgi:3'-phosphoadenosine 5'-phosphosulfate sulfotransferase (PAPS reductase)/FAD synthetase
MKIIVQYSGGKDSQASLLWAVEKYGAKNIIAQFSDTKWESPITYKHLKKTCKDLGVELIKLTSRKYPKGMIDLAKKKRRFPASKTRFCTSELKVIPFIDWLLDEVKDNVLIIQGIRKSESLARSKMNEDCRLFKYYVEPFKYNTKGKPQTHSYRKKDVLNFIKKYDDSIFRPFFNSSGQDVIDFIYAKGQEPNELYKMGLSRVGCFPCIMATHNEVKQIANRFPERVNEIEKIENNLNSTFFTSGKIPKHACTNGKFPNIREVVNYIEDKNSTLDVFEQVPVSCMSYYNQCE